jgi:fructose/tagatose bisphosphate aldolase
MPLATLRQVLDEAAKGGYGIGAFNVNNMEQLQGIVGAAEEVQAPVIVQCSRGALNYAGANYVRHMIMAAAEDTTIPMFFIGDEFEKGKEIDGVSITDIAPTVAKIMGFEPEKEWEGRAVCN